MITNLHGVGLLLDTTDLDEHVHPVAPDELGHIFRVKQQHPHRLQAADQPQTKRDVKG